MPEQQKHLWEIKHPYYCADATWYTRSDGGVDHHRHESWAEFRDWTLFVTGDEDANLLVRWDWFSPTRHPDPDERDDGPDELYLFYLIQRKGFLTSHVMTVTDDDEQEVRAYLEQRWKHLAQVWAPVST